MNDVEKGRFNAALDLIRHPTWITSPLVVPGHLFSVAESMADAQIFRTVA
jgi:hypothetical protein